MIPKKKEETPSGGKVQTYDKITIDINERQFSIVQRAEMVKLRVFSDIGNVTFLLKNTNNSTKSGEIGQLNLDLDDEKFMELLNPQLKVVFRASNVLAPFFTTVMFKESFFAANEPLSEAIRKAGEKN